MNVLFGLGVRINGFSFFIRRIEGIVPNRSGLQEQKSGVLMSRSAKIPKSVVTNVNPRHFRVRMVSVYGCNGTIVTLQYAVRANPHPQPFSQAWEKGAEGGMRVVAS